MVSTPLATTTFLFLAIRISLIIGQTDSSCDVLTVSPTSGPADGGPDPALNTWRWLFETATMMTNDPVQGWRTVCVGLMTHPFFYSY